MACPKCEPSGGKWQVTEHGARRCDCPSGIDLAQADKARNENRPMPPVMETEDVTIFVEMMAGLMGYFPGETGARIAIGDQIRRMCRSKSEAAWLVGRMGVLYKDWPGTRDMRTVYCSKFWPLDGCELIGGTGLYPDGIPSENPALTAPEYKLLPPAKGERVSADDSLNETVMALAKTKDMRNAGKYKPRPPDPEAHNPVVLPAYKCKSCRDSGRIDLTGPYCNCDLGRALDARKVSTETVLAATANGETREKKKDPIEEILRRLTFGYGGKDDV